jgi:hypothetical protein
MNSPPQEIEQLTGKIIGSAIEVHRVLGKRSEGQEILLDENVS